MLWRLRQATWKLWMGLCGLPVPIVSSRSPISPRHPGATPDKLRAAEEFSVEPPTYPNGTHIAEVEIDPDTGKTSIVRYVVVDDFGATLNPLLLAGQVHGGAVQGIGQALMEDTVYDSATRSTPQRELHGLRDAARRTCARLRIRDTQRSVQDQSAWREGCGRSGRHRIVSCNHECDRRCTLAKPTAFDTSTCRRPHVASGKRSQTREKPAIR